MLPSRTGRLLRAAPNLSGSCGDRRCVTFITSPLSREDGTIHCTGFPQRRVTRLNSTTTEGGPSVAVIGAGAAGLAAGRILREEGLRVAIFERSQEIGGVWRYQPLGCAPGPMCESSHGRYMMECQSGQSIACVFRWAEEGLRRLFNTTRRCLGHAPIFVRWFPCGAAFSTQN